MIFAQEFQISYHNIELTLTIFDRSNCSDLTSVVNGDLTEVVPADGDGGCWIVKNITVVTEV